MECLEQVVQVNRVQTLKKMELKKNTKPFSVKKTKAITHKYDSMQFFRLLQMHPIEVHDSLFLDNYYISSAYILMDSILHSSFWCTSLIFVCLAGVKKFLHASFSYSIKHFSFHSECWPFFPSKCNSRKRKQREKTANESVFAI